MLITDLNKTETKVVLHHSSIWANPIKILRGKTSIKRWLPMIGGHTIHNHKKIYFKEQSTALRYAQKYQDQLKEHLRSSAPSADNP